MRLDLSPMYDPYSVEIYTYTRPATLLNLQLSRHMPYRYSCILQKDFCTIKLKDYNRTATVLYIVSVLLLLVKDTLAILRVRVGLGRVCIELHCGTVFGKKFGLSFQLLRSRESKSTVKRATRYLQLVLRVCCKTSWMVMFRVLRPSKKNPCSLVCCKTCSNVVGNTRNIAIQLVWQQSRQTSCTFYCTARRDSVGSSLKQSYNAISYRTDPVLRTILSGRKAKIRAKVRQFTGHLLTVNR